MHATDPSGFRPATDADLKAYADAHQSWASHTGEWMKDNWEYVAGGAMIIAGGVLIATGVGGPAGMMLISAGADTILRHHPGYITKAEARGASYFDVGPRWDDVVKSGRDPWTLNEHFLDGRVANGDRILMSTPKGDIKPGSYLEREVNHLQDNGYKWANQWSLHPG